MELEGEEVGGGEVREKRRGGDEGETEGGETFLIIYNHLLDRR